MAQPRLIHRPAIWVAAHRGLYGALIVALLAVQVTAAYSVLTSSSEVTSNSAIDEFRRRQAEAQSPPDSTPSQDQSFPDASACSERDSDLRPCRATESHLPVSAPAGAAGATASCEWVCQGAIKAPEQGVYEWYQCGRDSGQCSGAATEPAGTEELGGIGREFPRKGQRSVIVTASNKWTSYHQYSDEHKEEFDLFIDSSGVLGERYKVDITIGGAPGGIHIKQTPAARYMQFPAAVGAAWSGHWQDDNREADADYTGRIIDKQELVISGRKVRTWVVEIKMKLLGPKSRGDVLVRLWVSPEQRQSMQEFYDQTVTDDHGFTYKAKWMITLSTLDPKR